MLFGTLIKVKKQKRELPLFPLCDFFHYSFDPLDGFLFAAEIIG
jgi:hypothetical protein